jgi:bifunctional DNA-binding transcriptional regulator/antitoxin component of YhaV-PrlF toxin-antitoxin module
MNVQVTQEGTITLPESLCDANNIKMGDMLKLTDLGEGKFLLSCIPLSVNNLLDSLCNSLETEGETIESRLNRLQTKLKNI